MKKSIYIFMTALLAVCMTSCGPIENTQTNETAVTEVTYAAPETTAKDEETTAAVSETKAAETRTSETKEAEKKVTVKETKTSEEKTIGTKKAESSNKTENAKKTDDNKKAEETKKPDGANKYGYYRVTEVPQTSISVRSLTGDWTDGGSFLEFANCDFLEGRFRHVGGDKSVSGTVVLEYGLNPDNTQTNWFNLYDDDGNFYLGFAVTGEVPFNDLYTGQSGEQHFRRYTDDPMPSDFLGSWENGGVEANITTDDTGSYTVIIDWPEEEGTFTRWEYKCYFDEDSHKLVCNGNGTCTDSKRSDDGTFTDEIKYENASALFSIDDVYLVWQDDNDTRDDGWGFLRN